MDEDDVENFYGDYETRPKQVYEGLTMQDDDDDGDDNHHHRNRD
jgi:hypothetical protein